MKAVQITLLAAITVGVTLAFQNCGRASMITVGDDTALNSGLGLGAVPTGDDPTGTGGNPPVICDPFSAGSTCPPPSTTPSGPTPGLRGNVYTYKNGTGVDEYITKGKLLPVFVILSKLDIPVRAWSAGFPAPGGGSVLDDENHVLDEYFALDLNGNFTLPDAIAEGDYQFGINSDDGSVLSLDGSEVVNNDGTHAMQWKCGSVKVNLKHGVAHKMRLKYYQGPRVEIGLQVYLRPWSKRNKACDASAAAGFSIIPADGLSH